LSKEAVMEFEVKTATRKSVYRMVSDIHSELRLLIVNKEIYSNIFFVVDENVYSNYSVQIDKLFSLSTGKKGLITLKASEKNKSYQSLQKIHKAMLNDNFGRDTTLVAVGGGIVGDLAGFAASTYMRGIHLVHIPTTILAAVDSALGGKTAVNFLDSKNMIGTFYQPHFILTDVSLFKTLPKREVYCGMAEVIKYAFIAGKSFESLLNKHYEKALLQNEESLKTLVFESAKVKGVIVQADEREQSLRKVLNFGHTFGHGFESAAKFKAKHGEAIALGMIAALLLSRNLGILTPEDASKLMAYPKLIPIPSLLANLNVKDILPYLAKDKKNEAGKNKFVLSAGIGEIVLDVEADKKDVTRAILQAQKEVIK